MRAETAVWRLSFILPDKLYASVPRGPMVPCLYGCLLTVHGAGLVACEGRVVAVVLEQTARFLRKHGRGFGPFPIAATLTAWPDDGKRESLKIRVGRQVTFEPNAEPQLPGLGDAA